MRRVIAISAAMLGCGPNAALEVVVEMPPPDLAVAVDRVQLYVGLGDALNASDQPELLVPRDYRYPDTPTGDYWQRDPFGERDVVDVDPGATDVRFVFQEGKDDRMTAIVIGYQGETIVAATSLVDAYLDPGSVRQYHVQLRPASAAFPRPTARPVTVHRWGPTATDTRCAYLADPDDERGPSIYIVDHDDRDCDGLADRDEALECRPEAYLGARRAARDATTCVRRDMIPNATASEACVLGGPGCVDGRGEGACDPSATCVDPDACVVCANRTDALDCLAAMPGMATTATHVVCTFFVTQENGNPVLCPGAATLAPKIALLPSCDPTADVLLWDTGQDRWATKELARNNMKLAFLRPTASCDLSVSLSGTPDGTTQTTIASVLNVQNDLGRAAAVPITFTLAPTTDCDVTGANKCVVEGNGVASLAFAACLQSKVIEPW